MSGSERCFTFVAAVTATLSFSTVAAAAESPSEDYAGFEPSIHIGVGGFARDLTFEGAVEPFPGRRTPAVGAHLNLAYRFSPLFDLGLHVGHQWLSVDGLAPGTDATATAVTAGLLARLHPIVALLPGFPIDVSVGAGFDFYAGARQTTKPSAGSMEAESRHAAPGFALPVWLGIDVVFGDLALGVVGIWSPWWLSESCSGVGDGLPDCQQETSSPEHYLFIGLGVRLHLEFVR